MYLFVIGIINNLTSNMYHLSQKTGSRSADQLAKAFGVEVMKDCHEFSIVLPYELGHGCIRMIDFFNGLSLIAFDLDLNRPLELVMADQNNCLLRFSYCLSGSFVELFQEGQSGLAVKQFEGMIHADRRTARQKLQFDKGRTRFLCIEIDRNKYLEKIKCEIKYMPDSLEEVFLDANCEKQFLFHHQYLHSIHEAAIQILDNEFEGLVRRTFTEASALDIISHQILQYVNDSEENIRKIQQVDVESLKEARELIRSNLKDGITIKELSRKVGLNQNKLKYGFKQVFGETINGFLVKVRLDRARLLIAANEMPLRQIAEEVGYENKSFFARKFRERYGVLPSEFRKELIADQ